jgi:hypothetical protein
LVPYLVEDLAASEGSFMGFAGVRVSEAEKATLDDIAEALGTTA